MVFQYCFLNFKFNGNLSQVIFRNREKTLRRRKVDRKIDRVVREKKGKGYQNGLKLSDDLYILHSIFQELNRKCLEVYIDYVFQSDSLYHKQRHTQQN